MIDWNLVRMFVEVAEAGSISKAAKILKTSQPTLGRQMAKLETSIGTSLMTRGPRGIRLSERSLELLEQGRSMASQMDEFERLTLGARKEIRGTVRIAATEIVGVYVIAPILCALRQAHPALNIELVLDNRSANLIRGEADIAVRMFQPKHADLVGRRIGFLPTGLFVSDDYIDRRGVPTPNNWLEHDLIGFDAKGPLSSYMLAFDTRLTSDRFQLRTDSLTAQLELCIRGAGLAGLQCEVASRHQLTRVLPEIESPSLPLWLVAHQDVRRGAHIRAAVDFLADALSEYVKNIRS